MLLITGDLNTKVGEDNTNYKRAMGKYSCNVMNNNGECLADVCINNNWIEPAIDNKLKEEQAELRKCRGCTDQIFTLRNIIEQCIEWNVPLYINFIDFRKAFDSVHRETLWNILRSYGIPDKIITLISLFYNHFECSVIINSKALSEWFPLESGVRQGCILSPILFLVTLDWIMRNTTSDMRRGQTEGTIPKKEGGWLFNYFRID